MEKEKHKKISKTNSHQNKRKIQKHRIHQSGLKSHNTHTQGNLINTINNAYQSKNSI